MHFAGLTFPELGCIIDLSTRGNEREVNKMDIEKLIKDCIRLVYVNEGSTVEKADCAMQWNWGEIKELIEKERAAK